MKKKIILGITTIALVGILNGCNFAEATVESRQNDINTYSISGDVIFLPLSYENIDDGTINGIDIVQYVNIENKTVWVSYEKFKDGYGVSFVQQFDENNEPVLYDGDIEALKQKYNNEK